MTIYKSRQVSIDLAPTDKSATPVNRILQAFVLGKPTNDIYAMLQILDSRWVEQFSREEEEHARAVLEGLIAWRLSV